MIALAKHKSVSSNTKVIRCRHDENHMSTRDTRSCALLTSAQDLPNQERGYLRAKCGLRLVQH
jgi:hypothetical protein